VTVLIIIVISDWIDMDNYWIGGVLFQVVKIYVIFI